MPFSQPIIQALPSDVIAKIKSSTSIVHLTGVILELVKNSLDANAHTVFVTVDFKRGGCIVEDDGVGIPPIEFEAAGGLGRAHHTSKFKLNDTYGHRGLFLASLASLSLLTLTSHHIDHESTNSVIFHHSNPVARLIPAPSHQVLHFASHGTSVTVNDLFGNMPVRVKSRALSLQKPDELDREWDRLRTALVSILLATNRVSKLVLLDAEKKKRICIRTSAPSMSVPNSRGDYVFDLKRIESIFTQSGLINPRNWHHWHELSASIPDLTVRGAISLQPSPTRKIQFISLGKEPVLSRNNSNILYNQINRIFSLSDFANSGVASDCSSTPNPVYSVDRNDAPSNASTRSWARPINKWPMFYIRIEARTVLQLDGEGQEHFPESDKSIRRILDVLGAMLHEFLKQHKMRPQSVKRQTLSSDRTQTELAQGSKPAGVAQGSLRRGHSLSSTEEAFSTCLKIPSFPRPQSVDSSQGFANWSRVKAAKELKGRSPNHRPPRFYQDDSDIDQVGVVLPTCADLESDSPNYGRDITTSSMLPNSTIDGDNQNRMEEHARDVPPDEMITWIDPHTKMAYPINPRTGQKMNSRRSLATQRFSLAKGKDASSNHPAQGLWIENILGTWDNPSFGRTEMPISNMEPESAAQRAFNNPHGVFRGIGSLDTAQVAKYRGKLRRRGLEAAEVIAQVDKKFILAKVPTAAMTTSASETSNGVLVLVDQHAADERCRIEQLFREMFLSPDRTAEPGNGVRTVQVFIKFEVSETEGNLFHKYTTLFSNWGIQYDTEVKPESIVLITVHTLPVLIAERCRVEPQVLIDLIRREIWSSEGNGGKPFQRRRNFETPYDDQDLEQLYSEDEAQRQKQPTTSPDSHSWVRKLNGCPQGIIDLLNSRACRTAIMFNDPLNIQECQALVFRLARCAFPFQCAHGRPSMIPILDLRSLSDSAASLPLNLDTSTYSDENDGMDLDFMEAFRTHYT